LTIRCSEPLLTLQIAPTNKKWAQTAHFLDILKDCNCSKNPLPKQHFSPYLPLVRRKSGQSVLSVFAGP
jgi:hypothetical protein